MATRKLKNGGRILTALIAALAIGLAPSTVSAKQHSVPSYQAPLPCSSFTELARSALDKALIIAGPRGGAPETVTAFTVTVTQQNVSEVASVLGLRASTPDELATAAAAHRNARYEMREGGTKADLSFNRSTYNPCPPPSGGGEVGTEAAVWFLVLTIVFPIALVVALLLRLHRLRKAHQGAS